MPGLFETLKNLLMYKEPKNTELGFELLEGKNEGTDREAGQKNDTGTENENSSKEKSKGIKTPLKVSEWNKGREQEGKEKTAALPYKMPGVDKDLRVNRKKIRREFNAAKNQDIIIREFKIARKTAAFIVFIDGMADRVTINDFILRQLMAPGHFDGNDEGCPIDYIIDSVLTIHETTKEKELDKIIRQILNGLTALFIDGCEESLLIESRGYEKRNVDKPTAENVVKGAQEAFCENLRTNITLIRRIIKNKNLVTEIMPVGKANNSNCAILYMEGIVNPELLNEVKRRVKSIDIDLVESSGMLEQLIEDNPLMIFPQIASTERPDRTASFLLEGKVAIIADNSPLYLSLFFICCISSTESLRLTSKPALALIVTLNV